jgi:hypothetical protein
VTTAALLAEATQHGVHLWVEGGQVRVRAARTPSPDLLACLRANRDEVKRLLTEAAATRLPCAAWSDMPFGPERGRAFAEARRQPGACRTCAGRMRWCGASEPDTALRCATCHPPDHLPAASVREVVT